MKCHLYNSIYSNARLNEFEGHNPRVIALQNRWRTVWRMSVDRKKILEDALDTLLEVSFGMPLDKHA